MSMFGNLFENKLLMKEYFFEGIVSTYLNTIQFSK